MQRPLPYPPNRFCETELSRPARVIVSLPQRELEDTKVSGHAPDPSILVERAPSGSLELQTQCPQLGHPHCHQHEISEGQCTVNMEATHDVSQRRAQ